MMNQKWKKRNRETRQRYHLNYRLKPICNKSVHRSRSYGILSKVSLYMYNYYHSIKSSPSPSLVPYLLYLLISFSCQLFFFVNVTLLWSPLYSTFVSPLSYFAPAHFPAQSLLQCRIFVYQTRRLSFCALANSSSISGQ